MKKTRIIATILTVCLIMSCMFSYSAMALNVSGENQVSTTTKQGNSEVQVKIEATQMTVTVPAILPIEVDAEGGVDVATNAKIINKSYGAVEVTGVKIATKATGWTLVEGTHNFHADPVNSDNYTLSIDGKSVTTVQDNGATIEVSNALGAQIDGTTNPATGTERGFTYNGAVSARTTPITEALAIATVTFSVDWAD